MNAARALLLAVWLKVWRWLHPARRRWVSQDLWWKFEPPIPLVVHTNASLDQVHFRWRNDDGTESAASWIANEDTDATDLELDTNYRIRFTVDDTASGVENNANLALYAVVDGGTEFAVTGTSTQVRAAASGSLVDGGNTTRQLSIPTGGSFITPNSGIDEANGVAGENNDIDFVEGTHDFVEVEYCITFRSADLTGGETIDLRVQRSGGTALEAYTVANATTTIAVAAVDLSGSGPVASDGSGALDVTRDLSGTGGAPSDGSGSLDLTVGLTGSGSAASDGSGTLTTTGAVVDLSGSGPAASDGSGALDVQLDLSGSGANAADGVGTLSPTRGLTGSGDAAADGSGTLDLTVDLSGSGDIASDGTGTLSISGSVDLSGSGANASNGSGALDLTIGLSGPGDAAAEGSGTLDLTVGLSGSGAAASDGSGDLTVTAAGTTDLSGSGATASDGDGTLEVTRGLTSTGSTASSGDGTLNLTIDLLGSGDAASDGGGTLTTTGTTFWSPNPAAYVAQSNLYISDPAAYTPVGPDDTW